METKILTDKMQEFNGVHYYLCGNYFQKNGARLHRVVWEYHYGTIPKGYHVHHKDENRANNNIENLELLEAHQHQRHHGSIEKNKEIYRQNVKKAIAAAPEWHKSEEGRKWHSEHSKEQWKKMEYKTYSCSFCGKEFQSKRNFAEGTNHFCHPNCKAANLRRRRKLESQISNV